MANDTPANPEKRKRGFAAMTPERRTEVAKMGGAAVPSEKRAFSDPDLARKAGSVGGKSTQGKTRG
ncbi:MAG: stress-induced protein [Caulobacteraceae bacterium]|nr:stress-induced protein [Caulobacteraceae bacterium]